MKHRTTEPLVTVVGPDGAPLVGTEVVIEQTAHEFPRPRVLAAVL